MSATFLTFHTVWQTLGPELILAAAAFIIMVYEMIVHSPAQKAVAPWLSAIAAAISLGVAIGNLTPAGGLVTNGVTVVDDFGTIVKILLLFATILVVLMAIGMKKQQSLPYEYSYLVLFATVGAMIMASASDLVMFYVGLELLSIASYILVALYRKSARAAEGGLKYLIIGSIASATILYGMSFLYGISGSTNILTISSALQNGWASYAGLAYLSLGLIIAGLGVKISAAPFHLWTADVYEGAPTPITTYLAVVSKAAAFALLLRLTTWVFGSRMNIWFDIVAWMAVLTMVIGNFGALAQRNVKRMMAYSSIGHAGYILIPYVLLGTATSSAIEWQSLSALVFYLIAYAFMTTGVFAVYAVVSANREKEDVDAFAGLYRRSPWLAGTMALFLLSMAGMPLTGGFFGKVMIFLVAFNAQQYWLGVILFATSVVAFYYYFGILRAMFTREPQGDQDKVKASGVMNVLIAVCAIGVLWLGIFPSTLMNVLGGLHWFG